MERITKFDADQIAKKLCVNLKLKLDQHKVCAGIILAKDYKFMTPERLTSFWKRNADLRDSIVQIDSVNTESLRYERIYFIGENTNIQISLPKYLGVTEWIKQMKQHRPSVYKEILKHIDKYLEEKVKYNNFLSDLAEKLYKMRTYKKIATEFPEAVTFFPKAEIPAATSEELTIQQMREKIKEVPKSKKNSPVKKELPNLSKKSVVSKTLKTNKRK